MLHTRAVTLAATGLASEKATHQHTHRLCGPKARLLSALIGRCCVGFIVCNMMLMFLS